MLIIEILLTILFYLILPFYYINRVVSKKSDGIKAKLGFIDVSNLNHNSNIIHIHSCSVGEALAIEKLLLEIKKNFPEHKIVLTTFTCAGQEIAKKKYSKIADFITYFPFDYPGAVKRFLNKINPSVSIIVETEIWPYFAYSCRKRDIPLYIINARISDNSYGQYKIFKAFFAKILQNYKAVYAQSIEDMKKFISIGMPDSKVEMMGNLKFDIEESKEQVYIGQDGYKVLLAGSTHNSENEIVINTYKQLKAKHSGLKLLLAPRHLERVNNIKELLKKYELTYGLRSKNNKFSEQTDVIILDTLGELKKMYSTCYIAFIGGSFNKTGGHNPLEATICQKPVVSGPAIFNFKDIYDILSKAEAGKVVQKPSELLEHLDSLLSDDELYNKTVQNCKNIFDAQKGAIEFVITKLK